MKPHATNHGLKPKPCVNMAQADGADRRQTRQDEMALAALLGSRSEESASQDDAEGIT